MRKLLLAIFLLTSLSGFSQAYSDSIGKAIYERLGKYRVYECCDISKEVFYYSVSFDENYAIEHAEAVNIDEFYNEMLDSTACANYALHVERFLLKVYKKKGLKSFSKSCYTVKPSIVKLTTDTQGNLLMHVKFVITVDFQK